LERLIVCPPVINEGRGLHGLALAQGLDARSVLKKRAGTRSF
jgi:hypothetical protein